MKRIGLIIFGIFMCAVACATTYTQYWYIENESSTQTTCTTGGDITLPTAPTKYGYDFIGWERLSYAPIEYLESTGTQYIDTGYAPTVNTEVKVKASYVKILPNGTFDSVVGSVYGSGGVGRFYPMGYTSNGNNIRQSYGTSQYVQNYNTNVHEVDFNTTDKKIIVDGNIIATNITSFALNADQPTMFLCATHRYVVSEGIDGPDWFGAVKVYKLQIYNNNSIVRDFIPVLDPAGTPCMYDKVTGQFFYNQGTGQFIAGPVVTE